MEYAFPRRRHFRESGNPSSILPQSKMDSRFRGNDGPLSVIVGFVVPMRYGLTG
jgi:hypothetical protein